VVPKYINTPLDVIAVALIELMLPVSLKIAKADGELHQSELVAIHNFFAEEWGYSSGFVTRLIEEYREQLDDVSYSRLAQLDFLTRLVINESEKAGGSSAVTDALNAASKSLNQSTKMASEMASSMGSATQWHWH
jgi:hypothetical protein